MDAKMKPRMMVGPLLGAEQDTLYTVCFLSDTTIDSCDLFVNDTKAASFQKIADTYRGQFWRAEFEVNSDNSSQKWTYDIRSNGTQLQSASGVSCWTFHIPDADEKPRIVYASCNGFSSAKAVKKTPEPYCLWEKMREQHKEAPLSLLIMGGDQLYADEIWESTLTPTIANWSELPRSQRIDKKVGPKILRELDRFYENLYVKRWRNPHMSHMMASVPTIMMWDDHDIFDGWGSYKSDLQKCDVFKEIFKAAKRYFELFQLRSAHNNTLLNAGAHCSFGFRFRDYLILGLDNRSERTRDQVMSSSHWKDVKNWLNIQARMPSDPEESGRENLLVLSGIPVVYRSFASVEAVLTATPWEEELEDDVLDHWSAREHQGERMRLITNLMSFIKEKKCRGIILSGDVHVGGLGVIQDNRNDLEIYQVISSAIVHPPPSAFEWLGLQAVTSDDQERIGNGQITTEMISPFGSDKYIRARNYAVLEEGADCKVWVNWICEGPMKPEYGIPLPRGAV